MSPLNTFALVFGFTRIVNSRGAVSPTTRAIPSRIAVTNPVLAAGMITRKNALRCGAPRASAAERKSPGTSFNTSSLIRITVGNINRTNADEASQPAGREMPVETKTAKMNNPATIEGRPLMDWAKNLTGPRNRPRVSVK